MFVKQVVRIMLVLSVMMLGITAGSMAQEAQEMEFIFGKVASVDGNNIMLMVYDFDVHEEVEMLFVANEGTMLADVGAVTDLQPGDDVDIEYVEVNGDRVVKNLYKTDALEPAAEMDEEVAEEDMVGATEEMEEPTVIEEMEEADMGEEMEEPAAFEAMEEEDSGMAEETVPVEE